MTAMTLEEKVSTLEGQLADLATRSAAAHETAAAAVLGGGDLAKSSQAALLLETQRRALGSALEIGRRQLAEQRAAAQAEQQAAAKVEVARLNAQAIEQRRTLAQALYRAAQAGQQLDETNTQLSSALVRAGAHPQNLYSAGASAARQATFSLVQDLVRTRDDWKDLGLSETDPAWGHLHFAPQPARPTAAAAVQPKSAPARQAPAPAAQKLVKVRGLTSFADFTGNTATTIMVGQVVELPASAAAAAVRAGYAEYAN